MTGGASGLGLASARRLVEAGAQVVIVDLPTSGGAAVARELGPSARFAAADVTDAGQLDAACATAAEQAPLRALIHCAGRGGAVRVVERDGSPGSLEKYVDIVTVNLIGTFNALRLAAARMARNEPVGGDRGVCILTASVAAWEGQIGQIPYAASTARYAWLLARCRP